MWLHALAEAGELSTALAFGTFKTKPGGLPGSYSVHWLENGSLQ
jgi:hypothetical protein